MILSMFALTVSLTAGPTVDAKAVADRVMACLMRQNVNCAVANFHFPKDYTSTERADDSRVVGEHLQRYLRAFGAPRIADSKSPEKVRSVMIGGGSLEYWKSRPKARSFTYSVLYQKAGAGVITIRTVTVDSKSSVRDVAFGLPAFAAGAQKVLDCAAGARDGCF